LQHTEYQLTTILAQGLACGGTMDRKIQHSSWLPKRFRLPALIGVTVLCLITLSVAFTSSSTYRVAKDTVTIAEVIEAPFQDYINVRGRVEPSYLAYLDAVEGGIVEQIVKEEGALVQRGDTILVLSNLNLSLNILNSEAQLAEKANFLRETQISMEQQKLVLQRDLLRLENELAQTKRQYDRNASFYADELIAEEDFLSSKEAYELAKKLYELSLERQEQDAAFRDTQIRKIQVNLTNMERNLELIYQRQNHLVVKAPVSGQLANLNAVPGQSIIPGYRLGQVNVLSDFKLQASIDEHYIDRIHQGLIAQLERQNETYTLNVTKVYPEVNDGQFFVDLVFEDEVPTNIRSGQTYNLSIQLSATKQAVLLNRGAFFQSTGGRWIYRLNQDGDVATKHPIRIGRQNPKYYEVLEGLQAGDRVLISTYELFGENEKLQLD
jgi:HlyD family secretion protein